MALSKICGVSERVGEREDTNEDDQPPAGIGLDFMGCRAIPSIKAVVYASEEG